MFKPAKRRTQTSTAASLPAMTGGWNARDPLPMMKEQYAVLLDNFFPGTGSVDMRRGSVLHASAAGAGPVETLMEYASGSTRQMLACGSGGIYDVSTGGGATALSTAFGGNQWIWVNFRGFVVAVNGVDAPINYNGTAIATSTITGSGLAPADLNYVVAHKSRLYFTEANTLSFWYLSTNAIQGASSEFDLSGIFRMGGTLVALGSWTRDGGSGSDDLFLVAGRRVPGGATDGPALHDQVWGGLGGVDSGRAFAAVSGPADRSFGRRKHGHHGRHQECLHVGSAELRIKLLLAGLRLSQG
jgi:hypothetical protein